MFDFEIAQYLYRVSFLYEYVEKNTFKARAFYKAALSIDGYSRHIEDLYTSGGLKQLPSIGKSIEKGIAEIIETGSLHLIDELLGDVPATIFELYEHSSLRKRLLEKLIMNKIYSFIEVENVIGLADERFSKSEAIDLREALNEFKGKKYQYAHVYEITKDLIESLYEAGVIKHATITGDLAQQKDVISQGTIECIPNVKYKSLITALKKLRQFTIKSTNADTVTVERFGIPISICLREDDVSLTQKNKPQTEFIRFKGDLHLHTDWSDGLHSIELMRNRASEMGCEYIAITDHSQSLKPLGMSELDTLTQIKKIRELNKSGDVRILSGIEVDINPDGSLDLPDSILKEFDIVIASIHTNLRQSPILLTHRIEKALRNKYVNVLAHPTGRLLGKPGRITVTREEMQLDFDHIVELCIENNVALEINCFPERFDLSLANIIKAVNAGVKVSVGTDSHSMYHMDCAKYAYDILKFANIPEDMVLNCLSYDELVTLLKSKRGDGECGYEDTFKNKFMDFGHYFGNNARILSGEASSVGIDLTGSEKRASGFAVMTGSDVMTELVFTDDEMADKIRDIKPDIISIDSPLSLPEGRCCGDKNCSCAKHGIMRYCELTLKRFGIGVYPCLIDSMVGLTFRGIGLANRLRDMGFAVIESYPGVAQDLLHIPRKRKGLELLINGMKNFGIDGIRDDISHDEADAITSALVGYFYINNQYVGMGNKTEDYLIVPKLDNKYSGEGFVIGLVGRINSGKTTVSEYLRFKHGFSSMRFSKVIEELYHVSGRDELQRVGLEIAKDPVKQKELSDFMISKMKHGENYVIDGIRRKEDYQNLASFLGRRFVLINIEATQSIRSQRYRKTNDVSEGRFVEIDSHEVENEIQSIMYKSDYTIKNTKGYKELMLQVDSILNKILNRNSEV